MIKWLHGCKQDNGGYSLAEMLMVVGIIAVLAAVSFPAVINMRDSMRQTELDNKAREIFIAAQNRLSGLNLCGITPVSGEDSPDCMEIENSEAPSDYDAAVGGEKPDTYSLCHGEFRADWMRDTAFAAEFVKADGGSYVIEYNSKTALVYAVFYWEEEGGAFFKGSLFSYPEHFNRYDNSLELRGAANKNNRKIPSVGYYGGDAGVLAGGSQDLEFELRIKNEEDLQVTVSMAPALWGRAVFQITIESKTDPGHSQPYTYRLKGETLKLTAPSDFVQNSGIGQAAEVSEDGKSEYSITLDSLRAGMHFADNFPGIAAGDDLRISVTGYSTGSGGLCLLQVKSVEINSLFGGLRQGDGRGETVYIENGRHLQNLSHEVSGLGMRTASENGWVTEKYSGFGPRTARLSRDIDWAGDAYVNGVRTESWDEACTARGSGEKLNFYPISNHNTGLTAFDGNGHEIRNLHVTCSAVLDYGGRGYGYAGLFGYMAGKEGQNDPVEIKNVKLVNPVIAPRNTPGNVAESYAGALAGYLLGAVVDGCSAYIEGESDDNLSEGYENCRIAFEGSYAGGLVGRAADFDARRSSASLRVAGAETAGGFAGEIAGVSKVSECYSGGHTENGSYVRTSPNVNAAAVAGGFAGSLKGRVTVEKSFSTCSVGAKNGGPFAGMARIESPPDHIKLTYGLGTAFLPEGTEADLTGCGRTDELIQAGAESLSPLSTHPYDEVYRGDTSSFYPFPVWLKPYYGDWTWVNKTGLVYYERYQTESPGDEYRFWSPGEEVFDPLNNDLPVLSDGYGYLGSTDQSTVSIPGENGDTDRALTCIKVKNRGTVQYLYTLPWEGVIHKTYPEFDKGKGSNLFYDNLTLEIDGMPVRFYYNPHFARAIALNEEEAGRVPESAVIRTARHLYELAYVSPGTGRGNQAYWSSPWNYSQERNIDCGVYDLSTYSGEGIYRNKKTEFLQGSIGDRRAEPFTKEYRGNGYVICDLTIKETAGDAALFGHIGSKQAGLSGSVGNLTLLRPVSVSESGKGNAAGFASLNRGTITGVSVISPKIYSAGGSAAGFAVDNEGGILGSYVFPEQPGAEEGDKYHHIYGGDKNDSVLINNYTNALVTSPIKAAGFVNNNSSNIIGCGASGAVTNGMYDRDAEAVTPIPGGMAAGFVNINSGFVKKSYANCYTAGWMAAGFANDTSVEISGCYALRRVTCVMENGYAAGFAGENAALSIRDCYAAVSNGYCAGYKIEKGQIFYEDTVYAEAPAYLYPFSGDETGSGCYYMDWPENYVKSNETPFAQAVTYRQLKEGTTINGLVKAKTDGSDTKAYSRFLARVYPFPKSGGAIQYGDWPSG